MARKSPQKKAAETRKKASSVEQQTTNVFGDPVNSFTKTMRATPDGGVESPLQSPRAVRSLPKQTAREVSQQSRRSQAFQEVVNNFDDSPIDPLLGWRFAEPEHLQRLTQSAMTGTPEESQHASDQLKRLAWLAGAHRSFVNDAKLAGTPAIDEPHVVPHDTEVVRRWEDLSRAEAGKAVDTFKRFGYSEDPVTDVTGIHMRNMFRVLSEHAAAGTTESVTQRFYGGGPTSNITDPHLQNEHNKAVGSSQAAFNTHVVNTVMSSGKFRDSVAGMTDEEARLRARTIAASAVARTSPNTTYYLPKSNRYPNLEAAREVISAADQDRELDTSALAGSRPANAERGVIDMSTVLPNAHVRTTINKNPHSTPKTGPFMGAMSEGPTGSEGFTVTDVMESSQMAPHLIRNKSAVWTPKRKRIPVIDKNTGEQAVDPKTGKPKVKVIPDVLVHLGEDPPRGFRQKMKKDEKTGKMKPEKGYNEPEELLSKGPYAHALNDFAARNVNSLMGISRGVNFADNLHTGQAARWGSEQQSRVGHEVASADLYPVIRDWGSEGSTVSQRPEWTSGASSLDWMYGGLSLSPQFSRNTNTKGTSGGNPLTY